jgi:hypothetical protein
MNDDYLLEQIHRKAVNEVLFAHLLALAALALLIVTGGVVCLFLYLLGA